MDPESLLKTLLQELKDGVIVCDPAARVALFNRAAEDLFGRRQPLRKGLSLFKFCSRNPVEQAISFLQYQHTLKNLAEPLPFVQFMNTAIGQENYFRCRLSLLPAETHGKNSFVIILEDITSWYSPDNPLFIKIEEFRSPMTNLRASIENLTEYPEMSPVMRSAFENVLVQESLNLTEAFDSLAASCKVIIQTQSHLTGVSTKVLFGYVTQHLGLQKITTKAPPAQAVEVQVDIHGLILVLDFLAGKIQPKQKQDRLSFTAHVGEQFVYFDFIWPGEPLSTGEVKTILQDTLEHDLGGVTVAAILNTMDGDIWSQQLENAKNMVRLALPIAARIG